MAQNENNADFSSCDGNFEWPLTHFLYSCVTSIHSFMQIWIPLTEVYKKVISPSTFSCQLNRKGSSPWMYLCSECMSWEANGNGGNFNSMVACFLLCITYAHIDCYFPRHPSISEPRRFLTVHRLSLPFPSCLFRISRTGFRKDFHKCPLLKILHKPLCALRAIAVLTVKVIWGDSGIRKAWAAWMEECLTTI